MSAFTPIIALHAGSAIAALLLGTIMLVVRKGTINHRLLGWTWVALMGTAAVSSIFIRDHGLPNIYGYTPIHIFTVLTLAGLPSAVLAARRHHIANHRKAMTRIFIGGCIVAGALALMPGRRLGTLVLSIVGLA